MGTTISQQEIKGRISLESMELENFLSFKKAKVSFIKPDGIPANFSIITGPNGAGGGEFLVVLAASRQLLAVSPPRLFG